MTWICKKQSEVAEFFGVQLQTVRQWSSAEGMPGRRGHYDLQAIFEWWRDKKQPSPKVGANGVNWRARKEEADARLAELKLRELQSELVSYEETEQGRLDFHAYIVARLDSLPDSIAPKLDGLDVRTMRSVISEAITDLKSDVAENFFCEERKSRRKKPIKVGRPRKRRSTGS